MILVCDIYGRFHEDTNEPYIGSSPYGMAFRHQADIYESTYPDRPRYNSVICQAYREDGPDKFKLVLLARASMLDSKAVEQLYIDKYDSMYWRKGYNERRAASIEAVQAFKYRQYHGCANVEFIVPL